MASQTSIDEFLAQETLALAGLSRGGKKFGNAVHGECIMMFAQPTGVHRFHRWLWQVMGKLPKDGT